MGTEKMVSVTNRSNGMVLYEVPDLNIRRQFSRKETKTVSYDEIAALAQQPGGRELIYHFLYVNDTDVLHKALNIQEQPEYWLTEDKIPTWINSCSLNEFKDALDFAPEGIVDLIKSYSTSVPLNDFDKRTALKEQTGFDVSKAIENSTEENENGEKVNTAAEAPKTQRRSQPSYKVVKATETTK